ncbi:MAG: BTAD domain-containing putative transcriptional regulator, partial [Anaerolineae bacterium]|nr:BTAD domain-containing putative transcriptional regulator [Anaerolineae bacterium]
MAQLRLVCLGSPGAWLGDQSLAFPTRKALALLLYVAVEGGLHPRPKLMPLFWPNSDADRGRSALRSTLAYLRRAFDTVQPGSSRHFLQVEADAVGFNFEADYSLDTQALEAAKTLHGFEHLSTLQQAVACYQADFLDGFSLPDAPAFDEWQSLQRERWHRIAAQIFDHLSQAQLDSRHLDQAVATATGWIQHDPLHEAAYR